MPKVRKADLSFFVCDMSSHPVLYFYQIASKFSKGYSSYKADIKLISKTKHREITPKVRKTELSFLYMTCCLVLFYISTKFHKNIPKGIRLTEQIRNQCIITVKYNKGR